MDLHIHTTASDGSATPTEVVETAAKLGLSTISITDHESIEGCLEASLVGRRRGVQVIPGVELLTTHRGREVHLLGYFVDMNSSLLEGRLKKLREQRNTVAQETVERLKRYGINVKWDQVQNVVPENGVIGKNHILHAIREAGYIQTRIQAVEILRRYLSQDGLAYVEFSQHSFTDAVELIRKARGVPVVAHPALIRDDNLLRELLGLGDIGLEVYYYYLGDQREEWVRRYECMAIDNGLLATGGTDFHGSYAPVRLGQMNVPEKVVHDLIKFYENISKKYFSQEGNFDAITNKI